MITWGEFRTQIRRTILSDVSTDPDDQNWQDETLRDCVGWALLTLCAHTAVATATSFAGDGTTSAFVMPEHVFEDMSQNAGIYVVRGANAPVWLDPMYFTPGLSPTASEGFYLWPDRVLNVLPAPVIGATLYVRYFATYNRPYADSDTIDVPQWLLPALSFQVGFQALTQQAIASAMIDRFKRKPEAGNPDDNALRAQQQHLLRLYEAELARHHPQRRTNAFRELSR